MVNPCTQRDRSAWNAVEVHRPSDRRPSASARWRRGIDGAILVVGALAAHAAIGYFGWQWIQSNKSVPRDVPVEPRSIERETVRAAEPQRRQREAPSPAQASDGYSGRMQWTRRDGLSIDPAKADDWKCVGGYYFTMNKDANGTTVVEGVMRNRRPVRC